MKPINIWIWLQHREGILEEATFGLAAEAGRIVSELDRGGTLTAIAVGNHFEDPLERLGRYGIDRVLHCKGDDADRYHGEYYAFVLAELIKKDDPFIFLMAHNDQTADLAPRLAARLELGMVSRAVDLMPGKEKGLTVIRPVSDGHLNEKVHLGCPAPYVITLLPAILNIPEASGQKTADVVVKEMPAASSQNLKTELVEVIEASPEHLEIDEAEIVVAGGRGVGKDERFEIVHRLAAEIGGSVAGTRPVIDWQTLGYERQIGQTGKTVTPQLVINCGISGANEYTAGMEKSRHVIAINIDPRARIFRFADLGVVGDLHQILPRLIKRLQENKAAGKQE